MAANDEEDYDLSDDEGIEEQGLDEVQDTDNAVTQDIAFKKLYKAHPECSLDYIESVVQKLDLQIIPAGQREGIDAVDKNHLSYPFLNKYEITKIIGHRANEISQGARAYINVPPHITNPKEIARIELEQRRLPYIIKRPMPNGSYEYWRISDLLILPNSI